MKILRKGKVLEGRGVLKTGAYLRIWGSIKSDKRFA